MRNYAKITPEGTRDLLFEECKAHRRVGTLLTKLFEERGYNEVETPSLEFSDVFDCDSVSMPLEWMYKLSDQKGRLMVLRPDCTMPIARLAATRLKDETLPLRLFYQQNVYRVNPSLKGRNDQFSQAGIELIGACGRRADLEVIVTAIDALEACGAPEYIVELGHAGFFKSLALGLPVNEDGVEQVRSLIEAKNYAALNDLLDTMEDSPAVRAIKALPRLFGGEEVFEKAAELCGKEVEAPLTYLKKVYRDLCKLGLNGRIRIDLGLVHQNNYYTGVIFRGYMRGYGDTVLSGGRYDRLLSEFGCPQPATGFGVNVDSLVRAMLERGEVTPPEAAQVLVFGEDGFEMKALCHMRGLMEQGVRCESSVFDTLSDTLTYAKAHGIQRVDVVRENCRTIKTGEGDAK